MTDLEGSFDIYCNKCEFSHWCDRECKSYKLQSTIDAIELYNINHKKQNLKSSLTLENVCYKTNELSLIVDRLIQEDKSKRMEVK